MNRKFIVYVTGHIVLTEAALLLLPLIVSAIYREKAVFPFLITIGISLVSGGAMLLLTKNSSKTIYAKEGFVTVALSWILMSAIGALPFVLSGEIPSYVDAFFETVSGFTTTGATILTEIEGLSKGILFWRSFTHWIGGMGVLVFIMAVIPSVSDRSIHIMRAEVPGPVVGKLVPKVRQTAKILYLIYIGLTLVEIVMLLIGGMDLYDSVVHTFGTAGTGGFGVKNDSIASYSVFNQVTITAFMLLFGINFNLFYFILLKKVRTALKSRELWVYLSLFAVSAVIITVNVLPLFDSVGEAINHSTFHIASVMSTTGYSISDFNSWPSLSKTILTVLMFSGACAGSTAGGLKISRVIIIFKAIGRELKKLIHPRNVSRVMYEGKPLDETTITGTLNYFALYFVLFFAVLAVISADSFGFETNFSAVTACFNNIGPGFSDVGPLGNYSAYSVVSKLSLSFAMLLGRLEIYPLILLVAPMTWSKNSASLMSKILKNKER